MVHFDSSVSRTDLFVPGEYGPAQIVDAALAFSGGGTNFEPALRAAAEVIDRTGGFAKADVIMVTDGFAGEVGAWWEQYRKEKQVTSFGVAIGCEVTDAFRSCVDEAITVEDLAPNSPDERDVADKLFAI